MQLHSNSRISLRHSTSYSEDNMNAQIPEQVALAMRFDVAPDNALLPIEVVSAGTGISVSRLAQFRVDQPNSPPFEKRGKFIWYKKIAVVKFMQGE